MPGRFHALHGPAGPRQMVDLEAHYPKMLAHCAEYLDSVGDHPLNLASTNLALNAYMLTHEQKYRDWTLEYVNAWKQRTEANGGNIPTNIGLDGTIGGEYGGKWYKGTYGWNFTIYDGEIEEIGHRNTFAAGNVARLRQRPPAHGRPGLCGYAPPATGQSLRSEKDRQWQADDSLRCMATLEDMAKPARKAGITGRRIYSSID